MEHNEKVRLSPHFEKNDGDDRGSSSSSSSDPDFRMEQTQEEGITAINAEVGRNRLNFAALMKQSVVSSSSSSSLSKSMKRHQSSGSTTSKYFHRDPDQSEAGPATPKSPHNLVEEEFKDDPWGLLVATIFLNKTSCHAARPSIVKFLADHPRGPQDVLAKRPEDLEPYFDRLGLKKRAQAVWKMSHDYVHKEWRRAGELHGIGKYGEDAFRLFCLRDLSVEPDDRFLKIYQAWYLMKAEEQRKAEMMKD